MKMLLIVAVIGLLAVAGFVIAGVVADEDVVEADAPSVAPSCGGGCSAGNTCSNAGCGAKVGKSCGCRG